MSSSLVGYSSGEEDEAKKQKDVNYDDVQMDMSDDDNDDDDDDDNNDSERQKEEEEPSEYGSSVPSLGKNKKKPSSSPKVNYDDEEDNKEKAYYENLKRQQEKERLEEQKQQQRSTSSSKQHRGNKRRSRSRSRSKSRDRDRKRDSRRRHRSRSRSRDRHHHRHHNNSSSGSGGSSSSIGNRRPSRSEQDRMDVRNRKLQSMGLAPMSSGGTAEAVAHLQATAATGVEAQLEKVKEITGVELPKYYNPTAINPLKYAEQIKKRQMLWSKKPTSDESAAAEAAEEARAKEAEAARQAQQQSFNKWEATNFGNEQANEKFRRLMGIKGANQAPPTKASSSSVPLSAAGQNTAKLFADQEEQYERARAITHTQRGLGLGFSGGLNPQQQAQAANPTPHSAVPNRPPPPPLHSSLSSALGRGGVSFVKK